MTMQPRILALLGGAALFGQERGNIEALRALKEQGCEILCLVRDEQWSIHIPPALDDQGLAWVKVPYIEHRQAGRLRYFVFRNPVAFIRANWFFMRLVREFQPTHIHACSSSHVFNFLLGLSLIHVPMIYRAGDEPTMHRWVWRAMWWFVVRRATHFVAISNFVAASLHKNEVEKARTTVIYNAPPVRPLTANIALDWLGDSAGCRFVFVGQIAEHKGVHLLVAAFRQIVEQYPESSLIIAGRISAWSGDKWGRCLRDKTHVDPWLRERVTFAGEISYVPELLAACDVLIAPSVFQEPLSNVVPEAKAAGIPSIIFPRGGLPELIEDGVDGFVCPVATAEALADALRHYLADAGLARRHGVAALASLNRLGVNQFSERWLAVYLNSLPPLASPAEN